MFTERNFFLETGTLIFVLMMILKDPLMLKYVGMMNDRSFHESWILDVIIIYIDCSNKEIVNSEVNPFVRRRYKERVHFRISFFFALNSLCNVI
ncbi:MAG: hypothetical protein K0S41_795 [Anaerocolumna sp.]|jgi:hypothetical protein|nr:hypothetical protein [Anaerocolumna sp.]